MAEVASRKNCKAVMSHIGLGISLIIAESRTDSYQILVERRNGSERIATSTLASSTPVTSSRTVVLPY